MQTRCSRQPKTFDDASHEAGATGEVAAVSAGSVERTQQFVTEIAMACLHIDEVEAGLSSEYGALHEQRNQIIELTIGQQRGLARFAGGVEQRMPVRRARRRRSLGLCPSAGVRELKTDDLTVFEQLAELGELPDSGVIDQQLVGVGAAICADRRCFGPYQSCSTIGEALPAAPHEVGRSTVARAIPPLHRQHREPVRNVQFAGDAVADGDRLSEHPRWLDHGIHRQINAERAEMLDEGVDGVEPADLRDHAHASSRRTMSASTSTSLVGRRSALGGVASLSAHPRSRNHIAASWR